MMLAAACHAATACACWCYEACLNRDSNPLNLPGQGLTVSRHSQVRLDKLKQLRAVVEPTEDQRDTIAQLEAGEAADMQAVADFKLRSGGGEAAVRLDKLKQLRAVVEPSEDQRDTIAQLEAGEAADIQADLDVRLNRSHPSNSKATWREQARFNCMPGCRRGGEICAAIGYMPSQLDPVSKAPKTGEVPARVKIPGTHKECFGGKTPSRQIINETIDFSVGREGRVAGWPGAVAITRTRRDVAPKEAAPKPVLGAAGLASPVGGPDSPATPATYTAAGIGDSDGAATRNDLDDSGGAVGHAHDGAVGRAKTLATLAPDEEPPAKRAAVAEGSEARPASKAKAVALTKAVGGAAAAAKSKAVSKAVAAGKGKGDAHSNAGAKAAATAAPVPKTAPGVVALKQAGLLGFLVRPKPSTEPAVLPAAAVGGAE